MSSAAIFLRKRVSVWAPLLIVGAALVAYHNSLDTPLVLDDLGAIATNPSIRHLWPLGPVLSPPAAAGTGGRPLANLSFALNYAWSGPAVRGYHLTNLTLHALAGLVLFGLVRRTLARLPSPHPHTALGRPTGPPNLVALAVAVLWVLHPLQTASVTYLSQRTELLMALCYLGALYSFNRAAAQDARAWQFASIACCAAGMACKESMVTAPLLVWLYDRCFFSATFAAAWRQRRPYYLGLAASWLLLGGLLTSGLPVRHLGFGLGVSWWTYALTECQALFTYLHLALWPFPLIFDYGPIFLSSLTEAAPFALLLAILLVLALLALNWRPPVGFAAAAFFVLLAPTSSFVPVALQPIAENRTYLPLAALLALIVPALRPILARGAPLLLLAVAAAFALLTIRRNQDYQTSLTLWADTLAKRPVNPRACDNLAEALAATGRAEAAITYYRRALALNPSSATTHTMLGHALMSLNRVAEAELSYRQAVALDPTGVPPRIALSVALIARGQFQNAIAELQAAPAAAEENPYVHQNLGLAFARSGNMISAEQHYRRSLALLHENPSAHCSYANLLAARGEWREAATHYREAIRQDPKSAMLHVALTQALVALGDLTGALVHCETALSLQPDLAEAHNNLGAVLVRLGRPAEALPHFVEAVRLKPDSTDAARNLAAVRSALGIPSP